MNKFLSNGADPNKKLIFDSGYGILRENRPPLLIKTNPLFVAVQSFCIDSIKILLNAGANPNMEYY